MSRVRLANAEPHNHLMVPDFNAGSGGNFNLAITQTTTTILSIPPGQIQPPLMPVNLFPNKFKMNPHPNHLNSGQVHPTALEPIDKPPCDLRTSSALVSSSQLPPDHSLDARLAPLNGLSAVNDSISAISSSRSIAAAEATSSSLSANLTNGMPALHPYSTSDARVRNKSRQPKYRSTKRPLSERKFKCDHCESRFFTQKDVKRHLVVHTGVRNFSCPFCTQRFGRKDHLVRHAKKSHNQDTRSIRRKGRALTAGGTVPASSSTTPRRPGTGRGRRPKEPQSNGAVMLPLPDANGTGHNDEDLLLASGAIQHHHIHHHHVRPGDAGAAPNYSSTSLMPTPSSFYPANGPHSSLESSQTHHHHFIPPSMTPGSAYVGNAFAVAAFSKTQLTGNYHSSGHYEAAGSTAAAAAAFPYNRRQPQFMFEQSPQQYPFHLGPSATHSYYSSPSTNFYPNSAITPDSSAVITSQLVSSTATTSESSSTTPSIISHFSSPNDMSFKSVAHSVADSFNMCIDPDYLQSHGATSAGVSSAANMVNLSQLNASSFHSANAAALVPGAGATDGRYF